MTAARGRFAVNSYSYILSRSALDFIEQFHEEGHHAFELIVFPGHIWPAELDRADRHRLKEALRARDCRILTLNVPNLDVNIGAADANVRELSLRLIEDTLQLAADIDADCVLIGPGKPNPLFPMPYERMQGYLFAALDRLMPIARHLGVKLALENLPIAFLPTASSMIAALDRYGDPDIGIVYDVANAFFHGEDPVQGLHTARPRTTLIHVSDTSRRAYRHDPVGQGEVPFSAIGAALKGLGPISTILEIISDTPDRDIHASADALLALNWPLGGIA